MRSARTIRNVALWCLWAPLVIVAVGCSGAPSQPPPVPENNPLRVNVIEIVESRSVYETRAYYGTLKPQRSSGLAFVRGGQIKSVLKKLGDKAAVDEEVASLDVDKMTEDLAKLQEALDAADAKAERYRSNLNVNIPRDQVEAAQQEAATLLEQRDALQDEIDRGKILAPYDCVIAERFFDEGDSIPQGRPLFQVVEDAPPIVELDVASSIADQIEGGQSIWVFHRGQRAEAAVTAKAPVVDRASRTTKVKLGLNAPPPDAQWQFGAVVEVRFWLPTARSGYWLPLSALQREPGELWSVLVVIKEGEVEKVSRRTVELLQTDGELALVHGSLRDRERLIVDGLNRISPGQLVTSELVARDMKVPRPPGAVE